MLDNETCRQIRLSRDARFDGTFFVAVKTTGIYCRPVCPARMPLEKNVSYYESAIMAAQAGFRPCLRCRPDSAPGSPAWKGVLTTLERAIRLIETGFLNEKSLKALSEQLGVSDRYLRKLFDRRFGVSPKEYALYQRCLFSKQLLHQTNMSITDIAFASGFNSIRRFNDQFKFSIGFTPSELRRTMVKASNQILLKLSYRPPYAWEHLRAFYALRYIEGLEWVSENGYGRTFSLDGAKGSFTATHEPLKNQFSVALELDNLKALQNVVRNIRRVLDLDANTQAIEAYFAQVIPSLSLIPGLRLPGIWSLFEAGIRAILGQQVSVNAARKLTLALVEQLGERLNNGKFLFPTPKALSESDLQFLKIPQSRRETLIHFAKWYQTSSDHHCGEDWLLLKGIGKWTVNYAFMRGLSHPDIWLQGDLGIKKAILKYGNLIPQIASPWASYLTIRLWSQ